jgi:hypothetical protein
MCFFSSIPILLEFIMYFCYRYFYYNFIIYVFSASAIAFAYKMEWKRQLFFISIPSLIFMFVPYTESIFYAIGTILLLGLKKNKLPIILVGLFLESLVRPTTFVFVPAIIVSYLLTENNLKKGIIKSISPILILIIGLFITMTIHFYFTDKWFVFFDAQKLWKNYLHFPSLPLRSWGGDGCTRFDGSAMLVSIFCGAYIINLFLEKLNKQLVASKDLIFSLFYLFATTILIIIYRDGNLYSLNRFIYCTPFIVVTLNYYFEHYTFKRKHVLFIIVISEIFWLFFNSYNHIHNLLLFSIVTIYFVILLFCKHPNKIISSISILSLILINGFGLVKLFYRYLNNGWVG